MAAIQRGVTSTKDRFVGNVLQFDRPLFEKINRVTKGGDFHDGEASTFYENRTVEKVASNEQLESAGTVKWYNVEKGFGFIAPDNGDKDVFVHATALSRSGLGVVEEGQRVMFQSGEGKKGMEVRSIRLA